MKVYFSSKKSIRKTAITQRIFDKKAFFSTANVSFAVTAGVNTLTFLGTSKVSKVVFCSSLRTSGAPALPKFLILFLNELLVSDF